jgi:hypothetical protein
VDDPAVSITLAELEMTDAEPRKIANRSGLIHALTEAAELEHGLLLQYLFAAFSMKKGPQDGVTIPQAEMIRRWEAWVLKVAREEMAHLGTVCNLLTAIGGAPHFRRAPMPAPNRYFAQDPPAPAFRSFTLEPFSLATVERFVAFEAPPPQPLLGVTMAEPPMRYATIGGLYGQISEAFGRLDRNGSLFIGPPSDQDSDTWSAGLKLLKVTDRMSATAAIESIVIEGEGSDTQGQLSHWSRFETIRDELQAETAADPAFQPARPVLANPSTRSPGEPRAELVDDPYTRRVSELFNWVYATMLMMLLQHYSFAGDTVPQRAFLRDTIRRLMSGVIRPLGEILTYLPAHAGAPTPTAGPSFELYADLRVPARRESAWALFRERLTEAAGDCAALCTDHRAPPRLGLVQEHLALAARSVEREA